MGKKRICCFCEKWESGGIESFLNNVLLHLDLEAVEVEIVAACLEPSVFTKGLQERGVRFFQLSGSQQRLRQNHRAFARLLAERRYDVVHVHAFQGLSLYYLRLAKRAGAPVRIAHSHNTALRKSRTRPLKLLLHRLGGALYTGAATDLWACSRAAAEFLFPASALAKRGFRFIPNGIETARFRFDPAVRSAVRKELGLEGAYVVGNVGRLCYQKNQDFLLDVFAEILRRRPESRLLLVGEGELAEALHEKSERLGIAQAVLFYGVSDRVERLLWAMDVFAFPSRFEGLSVAAVEAQTAGLPMVCAEPFAEEARLTDAVQLRALGAGAEAWAEALLECGGARLRGESAQKVRAAGFDIADVSKQIENEYVRTRDGNA